MEEDKTRLVFSVWKPLWLAVEEPGFKNLGWTTKKPSHNNGFIEAGSWLIFDHIYDNALNFMMFRPGSIPESGMPEFTEEEIKRLVEEEALVLQNIENVDEISITPKGLLIKDFQGWTFNRDLISSKNIYVIIGGEEREISKYKLKIGDKIPLKYLLKQYLQR